MGYCLNFNTSVLMEEQLEKIIDVCDKLYANENLTVQGFGNFHTLQFNKRKHKRFKGKMLLNLFFFFLKSICKINL